jgi:Tannase and feruloyl esterase
LPAMSLKMLIDNYPKRSGNDFFKQRAFRRWLVRSNLAISWLAGCLLALAAAPGFAEPENNAIPGGAGNRCDALGAMDFSGVVDAPTQIIAVNFVPAADGLPAYCNLQGYIHPNIGVAMRLPTGHWNGKFIEMGCGGFCGVALTGHFAKLCDAPLQKGYACIASDTGHRAGGADALWAYHNPQALMDWAYRSTHVVALAGKAITEQFYRKVPSRSYFMGCSTGGQQGLIAAQRYPWDFDGIVAGAPLVRYENYLLRTLWGYKVLHDANGKPVLSQSDVQLLRRAVAAKCDMDDGLRDGVIGNPLRCAFDPAELLCAEGKKTQCLNAAQVDAVKAVYRGPDNGMAGYPHGLMPGTEGSWLGSKFSAFSADGYDIRIIAELLRYMGLSAGPAWQVSDFDFDRDFRRLGSFAALANAADPDLRRFAAAGGKLLTYQGWRDTQPPDLIDYQQQVEKISGPEAARDFFRLFMIPGMDHCGADPEVDYLGYLEAWVERGQAPDVMTGTYAPAREMSAGAGELNRPRTRAFFPYPAFGKYNGKGDPDDASSFIPSEP